MQQFYWLIVVKESPGFVLRPLTKHLKFIKPEPLGFICVIFKAFSPQITWRFSSMDPGVNLEIFLFSTTSAIANVTRTDLPVSFET